MRKTQRLTFIPEIVMIIMLLALIASSCTPKSQMMTKAVVLDCSPEKTSTGHVQYRLKYLSYDVVDYDFNYFQYEIGDTIIVHDKFRNTDIQ